MYRRWWLQSRYSYVGRQYTGGIQARDWDDVLFVVQTDARPQWSEIGDWMPLTRCSRTGGLVVHDPVLFQGSYEDCGVLPVISLIDLGSSYDTATLLSWI